MQLIGNLHEHMVFPHRVQRLSELLADALPVAGTILDVGCGDGRIGKRVAELVPGSAVEGIDVLVRPQAVIDVHQYDGEHFPYADDSVDIVLLVDVLHHTSDPVRILAEGRRVARVGIVLKDHVLAGMGASFTLRMMDWVGNYRHGVVLPYNYWTWPQWDKAITQLGLEVSRWDTHLKLYPAPVRPLFERSLHFLGVLLVNKGNVAAQATR
jgi:SAM-dependent methyltransferase